MYINTRGPWTLIRSHEFLLTRELISNPNFNIIMYICISLSLFIVPNTKVGELEELRGVLRFEELNEVFLSEEFLSSSCPIW